MSEAPEIVEREFFVFPNCSKDDVLRKDPVLWERIRIINHEVHFVDETDV